MVRRPDRPREGDVLAAKSTALVDEEEAVGEGVAAELGEHLLRHIVPVTREVPMKGLTNL